jgi:phosphoribosylformylglycinamidine synthase subunit PurS
VARIIVEVMLKPEIHDPQGEAVASACRRLGLGQVRGVRQGKRFEVELEGPADEGAVTAITELARDLLSNPVIEEFTLHADLRPASPDPQAWFQSRSRGITRTVSASWQMTVGTGLQDAREIGS